MQKILKNVNPGTKTLNFITDRLLGKAKDAQTQRAKTLIDGSVNPICYLKMNFIVRFTSIDTRI